MEDFLDEEDSLIRCYCCGHWVRMIATKVVYIGARRDEEHWCIGCIREVDAYTLSLLQPESSNESNLELEEGDEL